MQTVFLVKLKKHTITAVLF